MKKNKKSTKSNTIFGINESNHAIVISMRRYNIDISYLLCALGFLGPAGLHRLYSKRYVTGILYLCTYGFAGIGTIYDIINMRKQVAKAQKLENLRADLMLEKSYDYVSTSEETSIEDIILDIAETDYGMVRPERLAIEAGLSQEEAVRILDIIASKGIAKKAFTKDSLEIYSFPAFLKETGQN